MTTPSLRRDQVRAACKCPELINSYSDEFDGTSLDTSVWSWTILGAGAPAGTNEGWGVANGSIWALGTNDSQDINNAHILLRNCPSSQSFTMSALCRGGWPGTNYARFGLILSDGTLNNIILPVHGFDSGDKVWFDVRSGGSWTYAVGSKSWDDTQYGLRLSYDYITKYVYVYVSTEGIVWHLLGSYDSTGKTWTKMGLIWWPCTNDTTPRGMSVDWFRIEPRAIQVFLDDFDNGTLGLSHEENNGGNSESGTSWHQTCALGTSADAWNATFTSPLAYKAFAAYNPSINMLCGELRLTNVTRSDKYVGGWLVAYANHTNWYRIGMQYNDNQIQFQKDVAGTSNILASYSTVAALPFRFRIYYNGTSSAKIVDLDNYSVAVGHIVGYYSVDDGSTWTRLYDDTCGITPIAFGMMSLNGWSQTPSFDISYDWLKIHTIQRADL